MAMAMAMQPTGSKQKATSRRAWTVCAVAFGISAAKAGVGWPAGPATYVGAPTLRHYRISAILRQGVEGSAIRLVSGASFIGSAASKWINQAIQINRATV